MKRYTVSKAREQFADVLDEADRSGSVIIERGDVQYVIAPKAAAAKRRQPASPSVIESLDPAVQAGEWTWDWTPGGLRFKSRPRRRT
jgi:hypothetical protein